MGAWGFAGWAPMKWPKGTCPRSPISATVVQTNPASSSRSTFIEAIPHGSTWIQFGSVKRRMPYKTVLHGAAVNKMNHQHSVLALVSGTSVQLPNVAEHFLLAAATQNLRRLVRFLAQRQAVPALCTA